MNRIPWILSVGFFAGSIRSLYEKAQIPGNAYLVIISEDWFLSGKDQIPDMIQSLSSRDYTAEPIDVIVLYSGTTYDQDLYQGAHLYLESDFVSIRGISLDETLVGKRQEILRFIEQIILYP